MDDEIEEGMIQYTSDIVDNFKDLTKYKIHVSNLEKDITEAALSSYFSRYGSITDIKIIRKVAGDKGYNYSFITFDSVESANRALAESIGWSVKSAIRTS